MAAKKYTHGLPQFVSEVKRGNRVSYKYQRRVPGHAQADLGRKTWDLSLGGDLLQAIIRANGYREHHDQLLTSLADPTARSALIASAIHVEAARQVQNSDVAPTPPDWRKTEDHMKICAEFSPSMEVQALAVFAATAFGDDSWVKSMDLYPFMAEMAVATPTAPPDGGVELGSGCIDLRRAA